MFKGNQKGLLHQQSWTRKHRSGKKKERKKKPIQEKESYRWLQTVIGASVGLVEKAKLIHVAVRVADIFELFAQQRCGNSELLILREYNRRVKEEMGYLLPMIELWPTNGTMTINLERNPKRPARPRNVANSRDESHTGSASCITPNLTINNQWKLTYYW
ncbi:MAG: hypothetical protein F6J98_12300 [Moorea sp. SIO4G2]|nr:hypothetical protein [Moorena sp. SIO4G2]